MIFYFNIVLYIRLFHASCLDIFLINEILTTAGEYLYIFRQRLNHAQMAKTLFGIFWNISTHCHDKIVRTISSRVPTADINKFVTPLLNRE